jgi:hypothetical protein
MHQPALAGLCYFRPSWKPYVARSITFVSAVLAGLTVESQLLGKSSCYSITSAACWRKPALRYHIASNQQPTAERYQMASTAAA